MIDHRAGRQRDIERAGDVGQIDRTGTRWLSVRTSWQGNRRKIGAREVQAPARRNSFLTEKERSAHSSPLGLSRREHLQATSIRQGTHQTILPTGKIHRLRGGRRGDIRWATRLRIKLNAEKLQQPLGCNGLEPCIQVNPLHAVHIQNGRVTEEEVHLHAVAQVHDIGDLQPIGWELDKLLQFAVERWQAEGCAHEGGGVGGDQSVDVVGDGRGQRRAHHACVLKVGAIVILLRRSRNCFVAGIEIVPTTANQLIQIDHACVRRRYAGDDVGDAAWLEHTRIFAD